jgi:hypothetical protein
MREGTTDRAAEWEAAAEALRRDGYTAPVIARKLIELHGAPRAEAEAITSRLHGRPVDAYAGERLAAVAPWLLVILLALAAGLAFLVQLGPRFSARIGVVYGALGAVVLIGVLRAVAASRRGRGGGPATP